MGRTTRDGINARCDKMQSEMMTAIYESGNLAEWFNESALDYDFTIDSSRQFLGGRIWLTLGGPTVWVDAEEGTLNYSTESDCVKYWLCEEVARNAREWLEEIYDFG